MRASPLALLLVLFAACSTSSTTEDGGPSSCPDLGRACTRDDECCTKFCQVQGKAAYCIVRPAEDPVCSGMGAFCTQPRHCCSRSCTNGTCNREGPPPPPPPCKANGQACADTSECCVGVCRSEPIVGMRCTNPLPDAGLDAADAADAAGD